MTQPELLESEAIDPMKQPLLAHLVELRKRLINALLAVLVCFGVSYAFAPHIYEFLVRPWRRRRQASLDG